MGQAGDRFARVLFAFLSAKFNTPFQVGLYSDGYEIVSHGFEFGTLGSLRFSLVDVVFRKYSLLI